MDQIVITSPQAQAPQGHDEAMIAKVDAAQAALTSQEDTRPAWLPEKFKSVEDMAAAYKELEGKLSGGNASARDTPVETPPAAPAEAPSPAGQDEAAAAKAGLKLADLETEWRTTGSLSADNLAKLEAAGFTAADVQTYIDGRVALQAQYDADVMSATPGGADKYSDVVSWAKDNLTPAEIDAFNEAVSSGNKEKAKLAVAGLGARYTSQMGSEPNLMAGRTAAAVEDAFESVAQVTEAMRDPRYAKDPAYRAKVQAKLGRSNVF